MLERNGTLKIANVGDCGLRVIRKGNAKSFPVVQHWSFLSYFLWLLFSDITWLLDETLGQIIFSTFPQEHYFDCPYQLSSEVVGQTYIDATVWWFKHLPFFHMRNEVIDIVAYLKSWSITGRTNSKDNHWSHIRFFVLVSEYSASFKLLSNIEVWMKRNSHSQEPHVGLMAFPIMLHDWKFEITYMAFLIASPLCEYCWFIQHIVSVVIPFILMEKIKYSTQSLTWIFMCICIYTWASLCVFLRLWPVLLKVNYPLYSYLSCWTPRFKQF